jgi:hypothetical protein
MTRARYESDPLVEVDLRDPYAKPSLFGVADLCFEFGRQLTAVGISLDGTGLDVCAGLDYAGLY